MQRGLAWILIAGAASVRLAAIFGDLGIDEVWSWWFAEQAIRTPIDLFRLRHDNNHILNTAVIYVLGPNVAGTWYRVPPLLASVATVWLAGRIATHARGRLAGTFAMLLTGGSYLLILYGTEARGYSYALCCALLCWLLLEKLGESPRRLEALSFALIACLGLLSHLTFVYALAGFYAWAALRMFARRDSTALRSGSQHLMLAFVPPLVFFAILYFGFVRGMAIGGGPPMTLLAALISTFSIAGGGPSSGDGALIVAALAALCLGAAIWMALQARPADGVLLLSAIILAPTMVLLLTGHNLIYPRYFFVPVGFSLVAVALLMAEAWQRSWLSRGIVAGFIAAYLIGNGWWTVKLLDNGRGQYSKAIAWIASQSPIKATVSSDHELRNGLMFYYYLPRLKGAELQVQYVAQPDVPPEGSEWIVLHDFEGDEPYPSVVNDRYQNRYQLERIFRHQSLTGYNWWVYRRVPAP